MQAPSDGVTEYFEEEMVEFLDQSDPMDDDTVDDESDQENAERMTSPANQSSLASNVLIQTPASARSNDDARHQIVSSNPGEIVSSSSPADETYPRRRVLNRRRQMRSIRRQQRRRRPKKPQAKRTATPDISLEAVAGKTEDTYFALSLVGSLERLSARKRATAKLHILQYLTELAFAED